MGYAMPEILLVLLVVAGFALVYLGIFLVIIWDFLTELVANLWNGLTGETARRERRQEEAKKEEQEREREQRKQQREQRKQQLERERKRQQAEEKRRERFRTENNEIFAGIKDLLSTCRVQAEEIMRAVGAIEGTDIEIAPETVIWTDVGFILASFNKADSTNGRYIKKLWEEVTREIEPPDVDGVPPLSVVGNHGVKQLGMMLCLDDYDKAQRTTLSSRAATTYLAIASSVYSHYKDSLAARLVMDAYGDLLKPYVTEGGGNGYAGSSTSSADRNSNGRPDCDKCVQRYQLLDLPFGASKDEVKQKRRAWAEVLHPDQLSSKSERARDAAEQQLKSINEACDHILTCPRSGRR